MTAAARRRHGKAGDDAPEFAEHSRDGGASRSAPAPAANAGGLAAVVGGMKVPSFGERLREIAAIASQVSGRAEKGAP